MGGNIIVVDVDLLKLFDVINDILRNNNKWWLFMNIVLNMEYYVYILYRLCLWVFYMYW